MIVVSDFSGAQFLGRNPSEQLQQQQQHQQQQQQQQQRKEVGKKQRIGNDEHFESVVFFLSLRSKKKMAQFRRQREK